jgi:hypothetical protein
MKFPITINVTEVDNGVKFNIQFPDNEHPNVTNTFEFVHSLDTKRNIHLPKIVAEARTEAIEDIVQACIKISKTLTDKDAAEVQFDGK